MAPSIRVIGSLNVDMVSVTPRFPGPGETLTATSFTTSPGGKGANQAVACGRLSRSRPSSSSSSPTAVLANVEMVGAVGRLDAHFGTLLQPTLSSSGVSTERVRTIEGEHTGVAVIIVDTSAAGENRILFSPNANYTGMKATDETIGLSLSDPLPDIIVLQAEIPIDTVTGILRGVADKKKLHGGDVEVVFNPAPAPEGGLPDDVYASVDHLIMNETECELMVPKKLQEGALSQEERRDRIATHFHSLGVRYVIVTLGAKGVWYSAAEPGKVAQQDTSKWVRYVSEVPASKVDKVVDTTAAGDTFVGGYSVQIAQWREQRRASGKTCSDLTTDEWKDRYGRITEEAVRWGTRASAQCVQRSGAMDSIPFRDEI
ncbi:putative ribokinase [Microsporum canis]|uniref:Ribokinase n=1 Tax=Arthroderma otae (strain ATCC MYA-4605 / CBS 113480) TaxID=554155 RepID=C5FVG5_ARTOC|nr:ribokinase [Microsporum canis CBS 113480]EEQ33899.1 ribokinase [Microsporum canis CBS 113480]